MVVERRCDVVIDADARKVLGRIFQGDRLVRTQAWFLGRLIEQHPHEVRAMVENRYRQWAEAHGVPPSSLTITFGPLPEEPSEER